MIQCKTNIDRYIFGKRFIHVTITKKAIPGTYKVWSGVHIHVVCTLICLSGAHICKIVTNHHTYKPVTLHYIKEICWNIKRRPLPLKFLSFRVVTSLTLLDTDRNAFMRIPFNLQSESQATSSLQIIVSKITTENCLHNICLSSPGFSRGTVNTVFMLWNYAIYKANYSTMLLKL